MNQTIITIEEEDLLNRLITDWSWSEESGVSGNDCTKLEDLNLKEKLSLIKDLNLF